MKSNSCYDRMIDYNHETYSIDAGEYKLVFIISKGYKELRKELHNADIQIYDIESGDIIVESTVFDLIDTARWNEILEEAIDEIASGCEVETF